MPTINATATQEDVFRVGLSSNGLHKTSVGPPLSPQDGDLWPCAEDKRLYLYDASQGAWFSSEQKSVAWGKSGNASSGSFFSTPNGVAMTASLGLVFDHSALVTGFTYSRSNNAAASVQFVKNGTLALAVPLAGFTGVASFLLEVGQGDVISLKNGGPGVASNLVGMLTYRLKR